MSQTFLLAPMSPCIKWLTWVLFLLLPLFATLAFAMHIRDMQLIFWVLIVIYVVTWFCVRPTGFVVSSRYFKIVFPSWQRKISIGDIRQVSMVNKETFTQEWGKAMRIGVGGLWGGFGWLWTSKGGFLEFYISRSEGLVIIQRFQGKALLITPEHPEQFIATLLNYLPKNELEN